MVNKTPKKHLESLISRLCGTGSSIYHYHNHTAIPFDLIQSKNVVLTESIDVIFECLRKNEEHKDIFKKWYSLAYNKKGLVFHGKSGLSFILISPQETDCLASYEELQELIYLLETATENSRLQLLHKNQSEKLGLLSKVSSHLSGSSSLTDLLRKILTVAIQLVDAEKGSILLYNPKTHKLHTKVVQGIASTPENDEKINSGEISLEPIEIDSDTINGVAYSSQKIQRTESNNPTEDTSTKTHTMLSIPLILEGECLGVLNIINNQSSENHNSTHEDILQILSIQASYVLKRDILRQESNTDILTELNNRKHYLELVKHEEERFTRYGHPLSLMICDIDFFKKVNDTYGHAVGDQVLKRVSKAIQQAIRQKTDHLARIGGEEFALLLPETNLEGAIQLAERIRKSVKKAFIKLPSGEKIKVTLSLGVSTWQDSENHDIVFAKADKALYVAKEQGRNQVQAI
ncbi:sensor domain-containing diguanylate cyclase [bacterium]|nr:sensor domain-containing diguanylate cyclase [bacterium]